MNVAFLSSRFVPEYPGGAEVYTYGLARALRDTGHQVSVLYAPVWQPEQRGAAYRVEVEDDTYDGLSVRRLKFDWRLAPDRHGYIYDFNPEIERIVLQFLEEQTAQVVHITSSIHLTSGLITAAQKLGLPVVWTLTQYWMICPRTTLERRDGTFCRGRRDGLTCLHCLYGDTRTYRLLRRLPQSAKDLMLERHASWAPWVRWNSSLNLVSAVQSRNRRLAKLAASVDCIIAPSRFMADTIAGSGILPIHRIRYSPHGHRVSHSEVGRHKTASNEIRFGYTGHVLPHKGVHLLIEAFNLLQADGCASLRIFGDVDADPAYGHRLKMLAQDSPGIRFEGRYENRTVGRILQGIDVVVVPSIQYENAPVTIAEAFAARTPVIATDLGGMAEAVQHGVNGLLFGLNDADDLAQQMRLILDKPEFLEEMKKEIAPVRTVEDEMGELVDIYHTLTGID